jgi:hypothetical protein
MRKRPLSVTILGWVYIAVGTMGIVYHWNEFNISGGLQSDVVWAVLVRFLAIVGGAFLLGGRNWARWVALAWIAFHIILSAFHSLPEFAIHCLFGAVIAWVLFRPGAVRFFRPA